MEEKTNLCDWKIINLVIFVAVPAFLSSLLPYLLLGLSSSGSILSAIMSSSLAEYQPPLVPNAISAAFAQELKETVRAMVKGEFDNFYPEVVLSYASGARRGDAEGTGPGFIQAYQFIQLLKQNGILCFSGLHVPTGVNWRTFILRLVGEKAKAKVFIALLDHAYFESVPCMMELNAAVEANVEIVLVRMEDVLPRKENQ